MDDYFAYIHFWGKDPSFFPLAEIPACNNRAASRGKFVSPMEIVFLAGDWIDLPVLFFVIACVGFF